MKKIRRILSGCLVFSMLVSMLPILTLAETGYEEAQEDIVSAADEFSGICGDNLSWHFEEQSGVLTISGKGKIYDFETSLNSETGLFISDNPWFDYRTQIISVVIEDGVTRIGNDAFSQHAALESITIPGSVTSIGSAFSNCEKLQSISLPENLTTIEKLAFAGSGLKSVVIPDSVTSFGAGMFVECDALSSVTLPSDLIKIPYHTFYGCDALKQITIPAGVTEIQYDAFNGCTSLIEVRFEGNAPVIDPTAFTNTSTTVYYPADNETWAADVMKDYGGTIKWTSNMDSHEHTFGDWYETKAAMHTAEGETRRDCSECDYYETALIPKIGHRYTEEITNPTCTERGFTTYLCECGDSYVGDYTEVAAHKWELPAEGNLEQCVVCGTVETLSPVPQIDPTCTAAGLMAHWKSELTGNVFADAEGTQPLHSGMVIPPIGHTASEWIVTKQPTLQEAGEKCIKCTFCHAVLATETIPKLSETHPHEYTAIVTEPTCTEQGYTTYTCECGERYVDDYVDEIGHKPGEIWFEDIQYVGICEGSYKETIECLTCGEVLSYTENIVECVPSVPTNEEPTCLGSGTIYCVVCGQFLRFADENPALGHDFSEDGVCNRCGFKIIDGSEYGYYKENVFWWLDNKTATLHISGVGIISSCTSPETLPWYALYDSIEHIVIEDGITSIEGGQIFAWMPNLRSVDIADSVTYIGDYAFEGNTSLTTANLGNGIKTVDGFSFAYDNNLRSIYIGNNFATVGFRAFYPCEKLSDIYYGGTEEEWSSIKDTFGYTNVSLINATIHYNSTGLGNGNIENSYVRYFFSWEDPIAFFDSDPEEDPMNFGSQVTEETDTSFIANVDELVGTYVLVKTKVRTDGMIGPDILLSINPINVKTGTVTSADENTIVIDGETYTTPADLMLPGSYVGKKVRYYLYNGELISLEVTMSNDNVYAVVLNEYRDICSMTRDEYDSQYKESDYPYANQLMMRYYHIYGGMQIVYAFYDIDGNGTDELLVARDNSVIIGLYAFDGEKAVTLDNTSGERGSVTIYTDGTIEFAGANSASDFQQIYYRLENGYQLAEITPASSLTEVVDFDWTQLNATQSDNGASDDTPVIEGLSHTAWIDKHISYTNSAEYQEQVIQGFSGELNNTLEDIKNNTGISAYNTLDSINSILDFDLNLSASQEYELLLTQILFSRNGVTSIQKIYDEYLSDSAVDICEFLLNNKDFIANLNDNELKELLKLLNAVKKAVTGTKDFVTALDNLLSKFGEVSKVVFADSYLEAFEKAGFKFAKGLAKDQLKTHCRTSQECIMYLAAGEAYCNTADTFGKILLEMRSHIGIASELVELSEPIVVDETIWNILDLEMPNPQIGPNPLNTPVVLNDLASAIENFYSTLENYKNGDASSIANNAIEKYASETVDNLVDTGLDVAISLFECVPVVKAFTSLKDIFKGTQVVLDMFTCIDEQAYHGTMVMRLYCMTYIQYLTVDKLAQHSEYWGMRSAANSIEPVFNKNAQFEDALLFDEAISVYRAILNVAMEYAKEYHAVLFNFLYNDNVYGIKPSNTKISSLEMEQHLVDYEWCHTTYDEYARENSIYSWDTNNLIVYEFKCPISVTVKDETENIVAILNNGKSSFVAGYEHYFFTTETINNSGDYLKIAAIPKSYSVTIEGTGTGTMHAIVSDFVDYTLGETRYFCNIPITEKSRGHFISNKDSTEISGLIIDGNTIVGDSSFAPNHTACAEWFSDTSNHWHICTVCEEVMDLAAHSGGTATCAEAAVCSVCGTSYGDKDSTNHSGETEIRNAKDATEFEEGYTGDTYCLGCGELLTSGSSIPATHTHKYTSTVTVPTCTEQGYTTYTCKCGNSYVDDYVDATGHSFGNWYETVEATTETEGEERRDCAVCDAYETQVIEKLPAEEVIGGTCGENLTWTLVDGVLTISGTGNMTDYEYDGAPWYSNRTEITDIVIEAGVANIGNNAFYGCSNLTSVTIPDGVSSIGRSTFYECSSLTSIIIPDGVTSIGALAFQKCSSLRTIRIPDSVISIGEFSFAQCSSLTSIKIPHGITSIGDAMFQDCKSLTSIAIPDSVLSIGDHAFTNCRNLTSVTIPDSVTSIEAYAFQWCDRLMSITIPDSVTGIGDYAFFRAGLTDVTIPSGVTEIGNAAFAWCEKMTSVSVAESNVYFATKDGVLFDHNGNNLIHYPAKKPLETYTVPQGTAVIGTYAFSGAELLKKVELPNSVTTIEDWAFVGCSGLTEITIPPNLTSFGQGAFHSCSSLSAITFASDAPIFEGEWLYENQSLSAYYPAGNETWTEAVMQNYGGTITWVPYSTEHVHEYDDDHVCACGAIGGICGNNLIWEFDEETSTLTISGTGEMYDFADANSPWYSLNGKITHVVIHEDVTSIGNYAFISCGMEDILIPDSVTRIGECAFASSKIKSITIPNGVTEIEEYTFSMSALTSIVLPEQLKVIGENAFAETELAAITLPNALEKIGAEAFWDTKLTTVTIPENVSVIGTGAFAWCEALVSFSVAENNINFAAQEDVLFNKDGTTLIQYPAKKAQETYAVPEGNSIIGAYAFSGAKTLQGITLPDSITAFMSCAFIGCSGLTEIEIPQKVESFASGVFQNCSGLTTVTFTGNAPAFAGNWITRIALTAYYPSGNESWISDVMQNYGGTITWVPYGAVKNRITVEAADLDSQTSLWIDGVEYTVQTDDSASYIDLPDGNAQTMISYTYHIEDASDIHTQYPVSMKVWTLKNEDGIYTATRAEKLDNILQYSGSSIRVTGKQGIRMITSIEKSKKNDLISDGLAGYALREYGTVVAWASQLEGGKPLVLGESYTKSNYAYKKGIADPVFADDGNLTQYTNVLVGFSLEQCKNDLAMRPYMILEDADGEEITLYGGIVQRSIGYIALQNRDTFAEGTEAHDYIMDIIHDVYGDDI